MTEPLAKCAEQAPPVEKPKRTRMTLEPGELAALCEFFEILDRWDQEESEGGPEEEHRSSARPGS